MAAGGGSEQPPHTGQRADAEGVAGRASLPTCTPLLGRPSSRKAAAAASAGYRVPFTSNSSALGGRMSLWAAAPASGRRR